jgi:hypothetical protein
LTSSFNPSTLGMPVTFTVVLTGNFATPTGTVQFLDGGAPLGTGLLDASGQATFTTASLSLGTHPITAVYAATLDFNGVTSGALQQVVTGAQLPSVVTLQSSLNPSGVGQIVTFTAGVGVPGPFVHLVQSGTVTFLDGAAVIGTGAISNLGLATFSTSALAVGSHPITASYPGGMTGTQTIEPSVSPVLTQVVLSSILEAPPGFALTVTPNPAWVPAGDTLALLVTVRAVSGFSEPVTLSCSGAPGESTGGFVATTIAAGGGSTTLRIATTAPHACGTVSAVASNQRPGCAGPGGRLTGSERRGLEFGGPMLAGLFLLLPRKRRRVLLGLVLLVGFVGLNGCGDCTDLGTSLGNYTLTVTGVAAGASQSVALKLAVVTE